MGTMGMATPMMRPTCQDQTPAALTTTGVRIVPCVVVTECTRPLRTPMPVTPVCVWNSHPRLRAPSRPPSRRGGGGAPPAGEFPSPPQDDAAPPHGGGGVGDAAAGHAPADDDRLGFFAHVASDS